MDHEILLKLQAVLRRIAGSDDALQETNLRLLRVQHYIREPERYAKRVACRQRGNQERQQYITLSLEAAADVADCHAATLELAGKDIQKERLVAFVQELPPRQRNAMQGRLSGLRGKAVNKANSSKAIETLRRRFREEQQKGDERT